MAVQAASGFIVLGLALVGVSRTVSDHPASHRQWIPVGVGFAAFVCTVRLRSIESALARDLEAVQSVAGCMLAGLAFSSLLVGWALILVRRRAEVELIARRTLELRAVNEGLEGEIATRRRVEAMLGARRGHADARGPGSRRRSPTGGPISCVAVDVAERTSAATKVRGRLESAPDAIVVSDAAGRIVLVTKGTERASRCSRP